MSDFVFDGVQVVLSLKKWISSGFCLSFDLDAKLMPVGLLDLAEDRIFYL